MGPPVVVMLEVLRHLRLNGAHLVAVDRAPAPTCRALGPVPGAGLGDPHDVSILGHQVYLRGVMPLPGQSAIGPDWVLLVATLWSGIRPFLSRTCLWWHFRHCRLGSGTLVGLSVGCFRLSCDARI